MSEAELLDLAIKVDHLAEQIGSLVVSIGDRLDRLETKVNQFAVQLSSFRASSSSFHLVSSAAPGSPSVAGSVASSHDFNALAAEIPQVPDWIIHSCSALTSSRLDFRERAVRAWEAGWWAKFCVSGRINKVRPSKPIELPNSCYIVLQAEGYRCPLLCKKASDYRAVVGNFQQQSVSHGFASLAEAKAYCSGAGVEFPTTVFTWSSSSQ